MKLKGRSAHCGSAVKGATHCVGGMHSDGAALAMGVSTCLLVNTPGIRGLTRSPSSVPELSFSTRAGSLRNILSDTPERILSRVVFMLSQFNSPHSGYLMNFMMKKQSECDLGS